MWGRQVTGCDPDTDVTTEEQQQRQRQRQGNNRPSCINMRMSKSECEEWAEQKVGHVGSAVHQPHVHSGMAW